MGIAQEVVDITTKLEGEKSVYNEHCQEIAELLLPRQDQFFDTKRPEGDKRTQKIIDSTSMRALEKFAAAYDSITTPRATKWHRLTTGDDALDNDKEVALYLDSVNQTLFDKRYNPNANFAGQNHECIMSVGAFGTGVLMTIQQGRDILYRTSHIGEHNFLLNARGLIDVNYRKYRLTARQAQLQFGDNLPKNILRAAEKDPYERFWFIHCVMPNEERNPNVDDFRSAEFSSFYVAMDDVFLIEQGGFRTFPYHVDRYVTAPNETYGRSPAMTALPEMKMLNAIRKSDLRARHLNVDPPILSSDDTPFRRMALKPGMNMPGTLDPNGNPKMKPYQSGANINVSNDSLNESREVINDAFLVTLFQILVDSPAMTATEVLQRAQEKGSLLAPTAGRRQSEFLYNMVQREIDILDWTGQLPEQPDVLRELELQIDFTAPLNLMQKSEEALAAERLVQDVIPLSQVEPSIVDTIDFDEYVNIKKNALGVPAKLVRSDEEKEVLRQTKAQQQQLQQAVAAAPQVASSIRDIAEAQNVGV